MKANKKNKCDCNEPLQLKEVVLLFFYCKKCGYSKVVEAEKEYIQDDKKD